MSSSTNKTYGKGGGEECDEVKLKHQQCIFFYFFPLYLKLQLLVVVHCIFFYFSPLYLKHKLLVVVRCVFFFPPFFLIPEAPTPGSRPLYRRRRPLRTALRSDFVCVCMIIMCIVIMCIVVVCSVIVCMIIMCIVVMCIVIMYYPLRTPARSET